MNASAVGSWMLASIRISQSLFFSPHPHSPGTYLLSLTASFKKHDLMSEMMLLPTAIYDLSCNPLCLLKTTDDYVYIQEEEWFLPFKFMFVLTQNYQFSSHKTSNYYLYQVLFTYIKEPMILGFFLIWVHLSVFVSFVSLPLILTLEGASDNTVFSALWQQFVSPFFLFLFPENPPMHKAMSVKKWFSLWTLVWFYCGRTWLDCTEPWPRAQSVTFGKNRNANREPDLIFQRQRPTSMLFLGVGKSWKKFIASTCFQEGQINGQITINRNTIKTWQVVNKNNQKIIAKTSSVSLNNPKSFIDSMFLFNQVSIFSLFLCRRQGLRGRAG